MSLKEHAAKVVEVIPDATMEFMRKENQSTTAMLNERYALVLLDGKDFILDTEHYVFSPVNALKNYLANQFAYDEKDEKIGHTANNRFVHHHAFDVWMKAPDRRSYREVVFNPGGKIRRYQFNLYQGMSIKPKKGDCSLILEHIRKIWCREDPSVYSYVMKWLARMVQQPGEHARTIITLHSDEGAGKGIITDIFAEIFGEHSLIATHPRDITGRFNDKLGTSVFVCINEAVWGGRKEEEGILKTLATDKTITIEKKFIQKFAVKNCTHTIISSNNDWYAPLDKTDRRYLTLKLDNSIIGNHTYFDALIQQIEDGGKAAFLYHLMNLDITGYEPNRIPKVNDDERARLKVKGLDSIEKWAVDLLFHGELTNPDPDMVNIDPDKWHESAITVERRVLIEDCQRYARSKGLHVETDTAVGKFLSDTLVVDRKRGTLGTDGKRHRTYVLPKISDCRDVITKMLGGDSPFLDQTGDK